MAASGLSQNERLCSRWRGVPGTLSGIPLHKLMLRSCSRIGALVLSLCVAGGCTGRHSMTHREVGRGEALTPAEAYPLRRTRDTEVLIHADLLLDERRVGGFEIG